MSFYGYLSRVGIKKNVKFVLVLIGLKCIKKRIKVVIEDNSVCAPFGGRLKKIIFQ